MSRFEIFTQIGTGTTLIKVGSIETGTEVEIYKPKKDTKVFTKNKKLVKPDFMIALPRTFSFFGAFDGEVKFD